jgi:hypothetical protein
MAEWATGPDPADRAELVGAARPGADRARFDQELDQALDAARLNRDLRPLGRVVRGVVAGGVHPPARRPMMGGHRGMTASG